MAQQQLLLLVLSVIIVGVSLLLGITTYSKDKKDFERDAANTALVELATRAIKYRNTPKIFNGGTRSDGSSSFEGFSMEAVGATRRDSEGGGYDIMGDGSCFTGHATPDGQEFRAAWYPNGDCENSSNIVLRMTVSGNDAASITIEEGGYATDWRNND